MCVILHIMTQTVAARPGGARRGALAIVGGTAAGQAVVFLAAPLLSRLYPPEVFGPFAVINAVVLPFATFATMRLDLAVPVPDADEDADGLVTLGLRAAATVTLTGVLVALVAGGSIARLVGVPAGQERLLVWIPVVGGLMAAFTLLNQAAIRARLYGAIARRNLLQSLGVTVAQVGLGLLGWTAHGLAAGLALGQLLGVVSLAASLRAHGAWPLRHRPGPGLLRRYRSFPLVMMPSGVVNALGVQAPVVLVSAFYSATVAGWLGMAQRVLAMPISLIGLALAQVYLGEFGAARRAGSTRLERIFLRTSAQLAAVGLALAAVLAVAGPWLFATFLGARWEHSGEYTRALAVGLAAQMVASPLSQTLIVMGHQMQQAVWDVSRLALVVAAVVLAHAAGLNGTETMWVIGLTSFATYLAAWLLSWRAIRSSHDRSQPNPAPTA